MFGLPFHVARFFRATVLEVFGLSNAQLGDLFAVYGVTAMLAYFLGGPLADRFPARKLLAISLVATGIGGFYMATVPGPTGMAVLYGYWGVTTILLFWAALIRATREWGAAVEQGRAFGVLDGGRGLVAAGLASLAVVVFGWFFPSDADLVTASDRLGALKSVIHFYSAATLIAGLVSWFAIPDGAARRREPSEIRAYQGMRGVLRTRVVWVQALVVVCAYCGYKGLDNYSLYAVQVLGLSELDAARFTAAAAYTRPVAAVAAGFAADRFSARSVIAILFVAMTVSYGVLSQVAPPEFTRVIYANILISYLGVFGLRGVYFALLEETRIPSDRTGAAVGLISVVGYTPEIFFGPISGRILDHSPGPAGHLNYFLLLTGISALGVSIVLYLTSLLKNAVEPLDP